MAHKIGRLEAWVTCIAAPHNQIGTNVFRENGYATNFIPKYTQTIPRRNHGPGGTMQNPYGAQVLTNSVQNQLQGLSRELLRWN